MRLRKRGEIWFAIYYDASGKRCFRTTRCSDRRAAEAVGRGFEREAHDPDYAAENQASLTDALTLLLAHLEELVNATPPKRSRGTLHMHRVKSGHLKRLLEHDQAGDFVPLPLVRLTAAEVDGYIRQRRAEGAHENTIAKELVTLRSALKLAKRAGKFRGDLEAILPIAFAPEYEPRERWLTPAELQLLIQQLTPDHAARACFAVATSANWGETERARRDDETPRGVQIHGTKRRTRRRIVPIVQPWQRRLLDVALKYGQGTGGLLFAGHYDGFNDALGEACTAAKIPVCSSNDLRRTFCVWMRAAGVPAELVAPAMGHGSTKMVEKVYGRLPPEILGARIAAASGTPVAQLDAHWPDPSDSPDGSGGGKSAKMVPGAGVEPARPRGAEDFKAPDEWDLTPRRRYGRRVYRFADGTPVAQRAAALGIAVVRPRTRR